MPKFISQPLTCSSCFNKNLGHSELFWKFGGYFVLLVGNKFLGNYSNYSLSKEQIFLGWQKPSSRISHHSVSLVFVKDLNIYLQHLDKK